MAINDGKVMLLKPNENADSDKSWVATDMQIFSQVTSQTEKNAILRGQVSCHRCLI